MNDIHTLWLRLVAAARRAPAAPAATAPSGFGTRVAALALAADRPLSALLERLSWRALGVALLLMAAGFAVNYQALNNAQTDTPGVEDPVAEVLSAS